MFKQILIGITMITALTISSTSSACAQWITQQHGGAFDNDALQVAVTANGGYGLGLRCKSDTSEVVLITQDRSFDDETLKLANAIGAKLLLRIDGGEILRLNALIEKIDGKAVFVADAEVTLFRTIGSAKSSVAAAVELLGKRYHENAFGVRGTRASMNSLITKCKLDER